MSVQMLLALKHTGGTDKLAMVAIGDSMLALLYRILAPDAVRCKLDKIFPKDTANAIFSGCRKYAADKKLELSYMEWTSEDYQRIVELESLEATEVAAKANAELDCIDQKLSIIAIVLHVLTVNKERVDDSAAEDEV